MRLKKTENSDRSDHICHGRNAFILVFLTINFGVFRTVYEDYVALHADMHEELQYLNNTRKSNPQVLFFNRVSKTGSTSMIEALKNLQGPNNFQMNAYKLLPDGSDTETRTMGIIEQGRVVADLSNETNENQAYFRHFHFINFATFNRTNPIYFNMVRHPIARLESWFYYVRQSTYAGLSGKDGVPLRRLKVTLDECIVKNIRGCGIPLNHTLESFLTDLMNSRKDDLRTRRSKYSKLSVARLVVENLDPDQGDEEPSRPQDTVSSQIQYFCGYSPECFAHDPKMALRKAMHNVDNYFSVVGVLEELETTYTVLEQYIPQYFQGIKALSKRVSNKTFHKPKLSTKAKDILIDFLRAEIIFYDFCVQRLHKQHKALYFNSVI
ncbi:hypothetical protein TCAL_06426 [Tigriopus californicus]|uniref:Heparan sulfate 2-O-sulfotransferase pipe n=2 Tax=Tigriopus californicus TaxID=6832 RepID=A0A553NQS1_TIGCA|nr:hypothetical protein TCAL_06426 [Tigriopus californicus]